jgi:site-specific DNA-methyltransferase (adenine-specific)
MNIFKGDCLEVMKTLPDKSISLFLCDLPYGCLTGGAGKEKAKRKKTNEGVIAGCDWDVKIDLTQFWEQVKRLAKDEHSPVLMFCNTKFGIDLINSNPSWFRYDIVWNKERGIGFLRANKQPMSSHEMIYVFSKKESYYKRIDIVGDFPQSLVSKKHLERRTLHSGIMPKIIKDNTGKRCALSVINIPNTYNKRTGFHHPTQKPDELYEWLLKRYCPEDGTMLDPTAGSFASCFVAKSLGLKSIGIEKNESYFNQAKDKLES